MLRRLTALLLAVLLLPCLCASAQEMDIPGLPGYELGLCRMDGLGCAVPLEDGADLAAVPWGQHVTPRLVLQGSGDAAVYDCTWQLDGSEIPFGEISLAAGESCTLALTEDTAGSLAAGEHHLTVLLSGSVLCDYTFTLRDSGAMRPDPVLTYTLGRMTAGHIQVSGLVWRYKKQAASNAGANTLDVASAEQVERILGGGGSFGFCFKLTCAGRENPLNIQARLLLVAPNGFSYPIDGTLELSKNSRRYDNVGLGFFPALLEQCGSIPQGTYRFILFLNDMPAAITSMTLN